LDGFGNSVKMEGCYCRGDPCGRPLNIKI